MRAVKINSFAIAGPTILDNRCVPPAPGIIASFVSIKPVEKNAFRLIYYSVID